LRVCGFLFFAGGLLAGCVYLFNLLNVNAGSSQSSALVGLYAIVAFLSFVGAIFWLALCQALAFLVDNVAALRNEYRRLVHLLS
jgi:hypothetical protein